MKKAGVYLRIGPDKTVLRFDGVISVTHSHSLKLAEDTDADNADYVNNAAAEPERVTLSVIFSDAHSGVRGRAETALRDLMAARRNRTLCRVVAPERVYRNMLLSDLTAVTDETCPDGWTGVLTFTCAGSSAGKASASSDDRASAGTFTGAVSARETTGDALRRALETAGVSREDSAPFAAASASELPADGSVRRAVLTPAAPGGLKLDLRAEMRYLAAPDRWYIAWTDAGTGAPLTPALPLIASRGVPNDLLAPFRYLYRGKGIGGLYVLPDGEDTGTPDPARDTLDRFVILWTDGAEHGGGDAA